MHNDFVIDDSIYSVPIENAYEVLHDWWYDILEQLRGKIIRFDITAGMDTRFFLSWLSRGIAKELYFNNRPYKFEGEEKAKKEPSLRAHGTYGMDALGYMFGIMLDAKPGAKWQDCELCLSGARASQILGKDPDRIDECTKNGITFIIEECRRHKTLSKPNFMNPFFHKNIFMVDFHKEMKLLSTVLYLIYMPEWALRFPFKSMTYDPYYTIWDLPVERARAIISQWPLNDFEKENYSKNMKLYDSMTKRKASVFRL